MRTVQVPKQQLRIMAMIAYREGEISEERCCEIAGIKRTELRDEMLKRCGMYRPFTELSEEVEQLRNRVELLTHQVITCGVAASHPDANLSRTKSYGSTWDSPQAAQVRTLRDDRDRLLAECERLRGELASRNRGTPIDEAIDRMKPGASDSVVDMPRAACDAFGGD